MILKDSANLTALENGKLRQPQVGIWLAHIPDSGCETRSQNHNWQFTSSHLMVSPWQLARLRLAKSLRAVAL